MAQSVAAKTTSRRQALTVTAMIKKVHIYLGLLNFTILFVFGVAGLTALQDGPPGSRKRAEAEWMQPFTVAPNLSDKEIADQVWSAVRPPLSAPIPAWAVHRDKDSNLKLDFYAPNGIVSVTVLEAAGQLRIHSSRNDIWHFLSNIHASTMQEEPAHHVLLMRLWTYYTEFSIYSLIAMALSGLYLWLASRPKYIWGQVAFAAGCGIFIVLYVLAR
jgi:hypothetical protein